MAKKTLVLNKAEIGDSILFSRKGLIITGTVSIINDNSVIVNISYDDSKLLEYSTMKTVVGHQNYTILSRQSKRGIS